jgi:hypothetical protein
MRLVSSNSEAEVVSKRELAAIRATLRALAANILRVIRGAGRSSELASQAAAFIEACISFKEAAGRFPFTDELEPMLALDYPPESIRELDETERALEDAKRTIISGALQVVASELLGQRTQATIGSHELADGARARQAAIKDMHEKRREAAGKSRRAGRPKRKPSRKKAPDPPRQGPNPDE